MINVGVLKIRKSSVLSFLLGFSGILLIFVLRTLNFHPAQIIKPFLNHQEAKTVKQDLSPRLFRLKNTFKLHLTTNLIPKASASQDYDNASAYGAINFDTGEVIFEKNFDRTLPIASLTKIMTAVVALDLASPDQLFEVSQDAAKIIPTKIGVVPGQKMKLSELLDAALLTSANDAVAVVSDGIDEKFGRGTFVRAMNEKADFLGLSDTHFSNPQGFDNKNNHSSVRDLAVLSHYALTNYPLIEKIAQQEYMFLPEDSNHKQFDLYNWNGLLGVYPGARGLKIGNTDWAKFTTVVYSTRRTKILAIVLGAPGVLERDRWASEILDVAYQKVDSLEPVAVTSEELLAKYKTWKYWN